MPALISARDPYLGFHHLPEPTASGWEWVEVWKSGDFFWWQPFSQAEGIHKDCIEGPFRTAHIAYNDAMHGPAANDFYEETIARQDVHGWTQA